MIEGDERMLEAERFTEQAAGLKGPLAHRARRNAQAMRLEAPKPRRSARAGDGCVTVVRRVL